MPARIVVELPAGKKLFVGGSGPETGLAEVGLGRQITTVGADKLQEALGSLADIVNVLERSISALVRKPDKIDIEFGASLTGQCDLWIVSGEGTAEFKVTLSWDESAKKA